MKKVIFKAAVISMIGYPLIIGMLSLIKMFNNESFSFMGFSSIVKLTEHSASAMLDIQWTFFLSVLVIFVVSFLLFWGMNTLLSKIKKDHSSYDNK